MTKKILIRYGELTLKGENRKDFIKALKNNLLIYIEPSDINMEYDRAFLEYSDKNLNCLKYIFGINSYSIAYEVDNDLIMIEKVIFDLVKDDNINIKTFSINSRRHLKTFKLNSNELNIYYGDYISKIKPNWRVNLKNPDLKICIEVRDKKTYVFTTSFIGLGGMPMNTSGQTLHLLSGGIDSPVAANLLQKRGLKVSFLNFITPPHTDKTTEYKINEIVKILTKYQGDSTLYQINYTKIMNYLSLIENQKYKITLMRRSFYRIASIIAKQNNIMVLSNGESLAQVASQTLESICNISSVTNLQIFRPLLTNDKNETILISEKIGTYNISIIKACETCELFAPKNPITKPKINVIENLEKSLIEIENLECEAIENMKIFNYKV